MLKPHNATLPFCRAADDKGASRLFIVKNSISRA
jgi:hypothetical protein